jgi:hypothetical protein
VGTSRISPHEPVGNRPACFGSGSNPETGQHTPLSACQSCAVVGACGVLRIARFVERDFHEFARAFLNAKFPYGEANDKWRRRG